MAVPLCGTAFFFFVKYSLLDYNYSLDKTIVIVYNADRETKVIVRKRSDPVMKERLNNSQIKVMQLLWEGGAATAKELSLKAAESYGWNKNTTYTIIKSLVEAGAVERSEPDFLCTPLVSLDEVGRSETRGLVEKLYKGSASAFFSAFLEDESLDPKELEELKKLINEKK